jgi:hypothetical protein
LLDRLEAMRHQFVLPSETLNPCTTQLTWKLWPVAMK